MIHIYLDRQQQYWPEFGIDMLLGANLDRQPNNEQAIYFLPDYLMNGFDHAQTGGGSLVRKKEVLLKFPEAKAGSVWFTPALFFSLLIVLSVLLMLKRKTTARKVLQIFDITLFTLLGLTGLIMLYVWIFRVDEVCRNNINIFWALPTHVAAVLFLRKNPSWLKYYFLSAAVIAGILLIGFVWWPQQMNSAVPVLLLLIILRSLHQFIKLRDAKIHSAPAAETRI
jgi:hypothetical protein